MPPSIWSTHGQEEHNQVQARDLENHGDQRSILRGRAGARRQAAVRASTETINALKDPKHVGLLARVSQQIAEAIVNRQVEVTDYHPGTGVPVTTITDFYGETEDLQARAVPVDEKTLRTACQALEYASSIFARALAAAIESRMAGDDDFSPIAVPGDGE